MQVLAPFLRTCEHFKFQDAPATQGTLHGCNSQYQRAQYHYTLLCLVLRSRSSQNLAAHLLNDRRVHNSAAPENGQDA